MAHGAPCATPSCRGSRERRVLSTLGARPSPAATAKEGGFSNPPPPTPPREGTRRSALTWNCFISVSDEPISMGGPRGLQPTDTVRRHEKALVFVNFVHFVVPQTPRCGPVACGDDAACLLPTVRARKPCEVLQRRAGLEPRNTRNSRKPKPTSPMQWMRHGAFRGGRSHAPHALGPRPSPGAPLMPFPPPAAAGHGRAPRVERPAAFSESPTTSGCAEPHCAAVSNGTGCKIPVRLPLAGSNSRTSPSKHPVYNRFPSGL